VRQQHYGLQYPYIFIMEPYCMDLHSNLSRRVSAGEIIKPWLALGPFYENVAGTVPGLTLFEEVGGSGGRELIAAIASEASAFAAQCRPFEGQVDAFRAQTAAWQLVRGPELFLTWGGYYTRNHLNATLVSTLITPDQPGLQRFKLSTRVTSVVIVAINGKVVFESGIRPATIMEGQENAEFTFEAELAAGENRITLALLRIGRMARVGFRLELADTAAQVGVPLGAGLTPAQRSQVELQAAGLRLERDVLYPEHALRIAIPAGAIDAPLELSLKDAAGKVVRQAHLIAEPSGPAKGQLELCQGSELEEGAYTLDCRWLDPAGNTLTSTGLRVQRTTPTAPMPGFERLAERKRHVLEFYADASDARPVWNQIARYALGRFEQIDESVLRAACEFINLRSDTSDFVIHSLLRLLYWERKTPHLSAEIREMMKQTVLHFKYWVDEPGDTVMWMDSENHRFLFHAAEWLAGQLYPLEEFSNSQQRGLFHALKGRTYASEWMRQRGLYGFDEWHSNSYYPASMLPLFNIYDFAPYEDHKFRLLAGSLLDYMFFNLAADSYQGLLGTTHGRTYMPGLIHGDFEGTAGLQWLAFGQGALRREGGAMAPVALATSVYCLPEIVARVAEDHTSVVESRVRQGIASKGNMEFYPVNSDRFADFRIYRTPDYLMCGLQDWRKGEYEPAVHAAQVTLANKAVIFWSCPYTANEGGGLRPDYWSGNTTMPRVVQHRNVMALTFRLGRGAWMSHCFLEPARFDEVRLLPAGSVAAPDGNWAFARVGNGYVGIWSQHGYHVGEGGQYAGRELVCEASAPLRGRRSDENTWIVEGGRAADWGSFEAFSDALQAASPRVENGVVSYASPSIGLMVTGWDLAPTIEGQPIQLHDYPLVDSPWAHSEFGSGVLKIKYGDLTHECYFLG
jgi:hypothetical protein